MKAAELFLCPPATRNKDGIDFIRAVKKEKAIADKTLQ
ncbi:hypothetical protein D1BOALGB6SA_1487 [Olavius sp. associated proteobacterium Delta 1]|nr:hypothetical protein D1BOALGB6SA_1487 [Olavius sp. associated proteobacterium Delta 1]